MIVGTAGHVDHGQQTQVPRWRTPVF